MSTTFDKKLESVLHKFEALQARLASPDLKPEEMAKLGKEFRGLEPLANKIRTYQKLKSDMEGARTLMDDPSSDTDMKSMAEEEFYKAKEQIPTLEDEIKILLLPKDEADEKNAIMEFRAGAGGDEAALFAANLLGMYQKYAAIRGWRFDIMSLSENGIGGYKEATVEVTGENVFERLKFESGVHRVQRVPETEGSGRVHTSTATVAVMPEAEDVEIDIRQEDLRIDTYRSSGKGGQHVNTTDSAVRITHIPTGVAVAMQEERSQLKNREKAMKILKAKLYEEAWRKKFEERAANRKSQVGTGDRSERIRTYNYQQGRVTDHRINLTLYNLDNIMLGQGLEEMIEALIAEDQAAKLAEGE